MNRAAALTPRLTPNTGTLAGVPLGGIHLNGRRSLTTVCVNARRYDVQVRLEAQAAERRIGLIAARVPVVALPTGTGVPRYLHVVYDEPDPADLALPVSFLLALTPAGTADDLPSSMSASLKALVSALEEALADHSGNMRLMAHIALAMRLLLPAAASRSATQSPQLRLSEWQLRRALAIMEERFSEPLRIPEIAAACTLSHGYFARAFLATTGKTPYRWLLERRVQAAQQLLSTTHMSLTEVGLACGFAEQSHFTRIFRNAVGLPPGSWRRSRSSLAWDHAQA